MNCIPQRYELRLVISAFHRVVRAATGDFPYILSSWTFRNWCTEKRNDFPDHAERMRDISGHLIQSAFIYRRDAETAKKRSRKPGYTQKSRQILRKFDVSYTDRRASRYGRNSRGKCGLCLQQAALEQRLRAADARRRSQRRRSRP